MCGNYVTTLFSGEEHNSKERKMLKNGHSLDNMGDKSSLLSNKRTVTVFLLCLELSYLKYENQRQKFKVVRLLFLRAFFFFHFLLQNEERTKRCDLF